MAKDMDSVGLNGGRGKFRKDLGSFVDRFFFGGLFLDSSNALIYTSLTTTFLQLPFYRLLYPEDIDDLIAGNVSKGSGRGCGSPEGAPRVPSKKLVVRPPLEENTEPCLESKCSSCLGRMSVLSLMQ